MVSPTFHPIGPGYPAPLDRLFDEEAAMWKSNLAWGFEPTRKRLRAALREDALEGFIAADPGGPCGYATFSMNGGQGVVGNIFALPRARGIEEALARRVLEVLMARHPDTIDCQTLFMSDPGLRTPFASFGFSTARRIYMTLDRAAWRRPVEHPIPEPARPVRQSDVNLVARLVFEAHADSREQDASSSFDTQESCDRILQQIVFDGICGPFDSDASRWIGRDARAASACLVTWPMPGIAHVSEVATAPGHRRAGLARHCLSRSIENAFERGGAERITLSVTASNSAARALYHSMGFEDRVLYGSHLFRRGAPR